ncbi:hypothetical protein GCM10010912_11220 [Paenibacillus albidus]|uniref:Lipoprotein n=1 Tax=Paenibacillus albidus TaxID=2041023 RepID=A0A917FBN3_9BACL|nr:hypothetical protein [Paenibacillus albidus]GGF67977.1 hypothetical protein GCM10010912_11220 [Paenibacillus albidus]
MKKTILTLTVSFVLSSTVLLGACSNNETENVGEPTVVPTATSPSNDATVSPEVTDAQKATEVPETTSPDDSGPQVSDRPATKEFGELEGGVPGQTGTLTEGNGFSLYLFHGFILDADTGRLALAEDTNYYADIEKLPSDYNLAELEKQGQSELSTFGTPNDYSGELIEHPLGHAELYLQVSGTKGLEDYMVWKNQAGEAYLFRIHNPNGELSDGFASWLMVSLSTIEEN